MFGINEEILLRKTNICDKFVSKFVVWFVRKFVGQILDFSMFVCNYLFVIRLSTMFVMKCTLPPFAVFTRCQCLSQCRVKNANQLIINNYTDLQRR